MSEAISSIMAKVIHLQMGFFFRHIIWKNFCHLRGQIQLTLEYRLVNLWFTLRVQFIIYKPVRRFRLNMPHPNGWYFSDKIAKKKHLQMGIFYHFDLCHNVKNSFGFKMNKLRNSLSVSKSKNRVIFYLSIKNIIWTYQTRIGWPQFEKVSKAMFTL